MAPLVSAIREPQGGGSQAFVSDLARSLVSRGHEVHVYAATGSEIPGVTVIDTGVDPRSLAATLYRAASPASRDPAPAASAFASAYSAVRETRYDVIHNHAFDAPAISLATGLSTPVVHTLHLPPDAAVAAALGQAAQDGQPPAVACVSAFPASTWRGVTRVDAILPPFVPTRSVPWSDAAGDGAVFAGRLSPEKGAAEAIDIAQAAGTRIDVYGDVYDADRGEVIDMIRDVCPDSTLRRDQHEGYIGPVFVAPAQPTEHDVTHPEHGDQGFPEGTVVAVCYQRNLDKDQREARMLD